MSQKGDIHTELLTGKVVYLSVWVPFVIGLVLLVTSAVAGKYVGVFLALVIISGAVAATALLFALLRILAGVSAVAEGLDDLRETLKEANRSAAAGAIDRAGAAKPSLVRTLDLSAMGGGDPSRLAAATLDRDVFPRLVKTMDEEPPARSGEHGDPTPARVGGATRPAAEDLLREWKLALANEDLAGCRAVFSALVDTAGAHRIARLRTEMEALADRTERRLRLAFSIRVREHDYAGAVAIGERISSLLADRPIAEDFKRIRPCLVGRAQARSVVG